jgi:hypothetical protein
MEPLIPMNDGGALVVPEFTHSALSDSGDIRLLQIQDGDFDDPVFCTLQAYSRREVTYLYQAIAYT